MARPVEEKAAEESPAEPEPCAETHQGEDPEGEEEEYEDHGEDVRREDAQDELRILLGTLAEENVPAAEDVGSLEEDEGHQESHSEAEKHSDADEDTGVVETADTMEDRREEDEDDDDDDWLEGGGEEDEGGGEEEEDEVQDHLDEAEEHAASEAAEKLHVGAESGMQSERPTQEGEAASDVGAEAPRATTRQASAAKEQPRRQDPADWWPPLPAASAGAASSGRRWAPALRGDAAEGPAGSYSDLASELRRLEAENRELRTEIGQERFRSQQLLKQREQALQAHQRDLQARQAEARATKELEEMRGSADKSKEFYRNEQATLLLEVRGLELRLQEAGDREAGLRLEMQDLQEQLGPLQERLAEACQDRDRWQREASKQSEKLKRSDQRLQQLEQKHVDDKAKIKALAEALRTAADCGELSPETVAQLRSQAGKDAAGRPASHGKRGRPEQTPSGHVDRADSQRCAAQQSSGALAHGARGGARLLGSAAASGWALLVGPRPARLEELEPSESRKEDRKRARGGAAAPPKRGGARGAQAVTDETQASMQSKILLLLVTLIVAMAAAKLTA